MKKFIYRFLLLIPGSTLVLLAGMLNGQPDTGPNQKVLQLLEQAESATSDSMKIEHLFALARFYNDYMGDEIKADSISEVALSVALSSYRPELRVYAYNLYLESNDLQRFYTKSVDYAQKARLYGRNINNPQQECRCLLNLASVYLAGYQYDKALADAYRALSVAEGENHDKLKAESYLIIAKSLEGKNLDLEAFRNYLNALKLSKKLDDRSLLVKCYDRLSGFYLQNKMYDRATHYKLKQGDLERANRPVDSLALMWIVYDLQVIAVNANNRLSGKFSNDIMQYAIRHRVNRLKDYEMALYRTYLIKNGMKKQLQDLYTKKYPLEFQQLRQKNPALYYKLQAYFYNYRGLTDSATRYFEMAEQHIRASPNKILQSNFYKRFGEFLIQAGNTNDAFEKFSRSFQLAEQASYAEYMLAAGAQLEKMYARTGRFEEAYAYANINNDLRETIRQADKKERMLSMEIDHEAEQQALIEKREAENTLRRHNLQYTGIVVAIVSVFVILIMLGSFTVPKWMIQMLGFFSFIFLFEFIILLADHRIHLWTHGEPWKIMLIKIFLIAALLPLHHWIEKQVVGYLVSHRLINFSAFSPGKLSKKVLGIFKQ